MSQQVQIVDEPLTATGTWMTPPQVTNMCQYQDGGLWLGRNGDDVRSSIGRNDESHVLLCAMNRSGKGRGLITNNLLLWKGSVFCNDPKGENASVCAARRGQGSEHTTKFLDQKTCVLDSHHTAKVDARYRAYYNVLNDLDPNDEDSASLAEDIAEACITEDVKKDPTWDDMAKPFMKSLLLHIITAPSSDDPTKGYIPDDERDLVTFRKIILTGDFNGLRFCIAHLGLEAVQLDEPDLFELLLSRMKTNPSFGGIISDYARSLEKDMVMQPKLWNSIRSAAATATSWIDDQKMRKVLRAGTYPQTFSAREFKENPKGLSLFVCLRLKDQKKYSAWPRILNNMVMGFAQEDYNASPATGHSTLVMLDEMAALGRMVKMEDDISGIAGAGVKIFMVLQSLSQAQSSYGDNWNNFVANAGTQVYFGINDNFTAEYVSKRLGEVEVIRKMRSGSRATMEGTTVSDTTGGSHTDQTSQGQTNQRGSSSGYGGGSNYQDSYGTGASVSNGWSPSLFHISLITSLNRGRSSQRNSAQGGNKTWQQAKQQSRSDTHSQSESDTENWSRTVAQQRSETITEGWAESLFKRPLAAINDLIKLFGTVEDTNAQNYPGIGLVVTSSSMLDPFMIIKCYYDRDPFFRGMFDPHPKWGIAANDDVPKPVLITANRRSATISLTVPKRYWNTKERHNPESAFEPRYKMERNATISNPDAHVRYYNDRMVVVPRAGMREGSTFRKGDIIADYYFRITDVGRPSDHDKIFSLEAPADGMIKVVYDFGYTAVFNGKKITIKNQPEYDDILISKTASDGARIERLDRTEVQMELELFNISNNSNLQKFKAAIKDFPDLYHAQENTRHASWSSKNSLKEHYQSLPLSILGCLTPFLVILALFYNFRVVYPTLFFLVLACLSFESSREKFFGFLNRLHPYDAWQAFLGLFGQNEFIKREKKVAALASDIEQPYKQLKSDLNLKL